MVIRWTTTVHRSLTEEALAIKMDLLMRRDLLQSVKFADCLFPPRQFWKIICVDLDMQEGLSLSKHLSNYITKLCVASCRQLIHTSPVAGKSTVPSCETSLPFCERHFCTEAVTRQLPIPDFISHGQLTHPSQTKWVVVMLYLFHRASSFVPSVSTLLATQDSPNVSSTAFPGYLYQGCCYVALCVFNSSFRTLDPPTRTFIMPL